MTLEEAVANRMVAYWKQAWKDEHIEPGMCADFQLSWKNFMGSHRDEFFERAATNQLTDSQKAMVFGIFDYIKTLSEGESYDYGMDTVKCVEIAKAVVGAVETDTGHWYVPKKIPEDVSVH